MSQSAEQTMIEMSEAEFGSQLHEALAQVSTEGDRIVIRLGQQGAVVVVPIEDLDAIQEMENKADIKAARAVLEEMKGTGETPLPLEEYIKKFGDGA